MKSLIFFNIVFMMLNSCNSGGAIQKETQNRILTHKEFIRELSFKGRINAKSYCNDCNFNKYQITIQTDNKINDNVELSNLSFPPYYSITAEKQITLSVNRQLYESANESFRVVKYSGSNSLSINGKDYKLLSKKKYNWIPPKSQ